jgi:hypothetical protein
MNSMSMSLNPHLMRQQEQQMQMHRSLSPRNYSSRDIIQNRDGGINPYITGNARYPINQNRCNQNRQSLFPSGERGNRYRLDPEQSDQQGLDSSERAPISNWYNPDQNNENLSSRQSMQQQQMIRSVQLPPNSSMFQNQTNSPPAPARIRRRSSDDHLNPRAGLPMLQRNNFASSCIIGAENANAFSSMRLSFQRGSSGELSASFTRQEQQPLRRTASLENLERRRRMNGSHPPARFKMNAHHSSLLNDRRRKSWLRDDDEDVRGSTGCVMTEHDRSELRQLETHPNDFPDVHDLDEGEVLVIQAPLRQSIKRSFTNQVDRSENSRSRSIERSRRSYVSTTSSLTNPNLSSSLKNSFKTGMTQQFLYDDEGEGIPNIKADEYSTGTSQKTSKRKNLFSLPKLSSCGDTGWKALTEEKEGAVSQRVIMRIVGGAVLFTVVITIVLFLIVPSEPSDSSDISNFGAEDSASETPAGVDNPNPPPPLPARDIEGRCSPSNFPGSIGSCSDACSVAACCYPGFSGQSCYDEANLNSVQACGKYRPHCDSMFAPWGDDALAGGVAPPPELFDRPEWDEVCVNNNKGYGESDIQLPSKRRRHSRGNANRGLNYLSISQSTCEIACLPGKCCFAPTPSADNFYKIDGIFMNSITGDMEMTSCINDLNIQRCLLYTQKCKNVISTWASELNDDDNSSGTLLVETYEPTPVTPDIATPVANGITTPTARASPPPSTPPPSTKPLIDNQSGDITLPEAALPQTSPTPLPTSSPTAQTTLAGPSIPLPDIYKIKKACTGPENLLNIAQGVLNSVMDCQRVCEPGLCCFADLSVVGAPNTPSCFDGNREVCMTYSDCLALAMKADDVAVLDDKGNYVALDYVAYGPPEPSTDVEQFCFGSSTPAGVLECVKACNPGSCCGATDQAMSCFDAYEDTCSLYGTCLVMTDAYGGDARSIPPPPKLSYICSYSSLNNDDIETSECALACEAGLCCLDNSCPGDVETVSSLCVLYEPCGNLLPMPMPSDDIQQICGYTEQGCDDACAVSSCCFTDDDNPCFQNFQEACISYAPYCAPSMEESDVVSIELQSAPLDLDQLCAGPSVSLSCQEACSAAACCFMSSELENCWAENESVCGQYAICAYLYQEYEESQDQFI